MASVDLDGSRDLTGSHSLLRRGLLSLSAIVLAVASFVHLASEVAPERLGPLLNTGTSLSGNALTGLTDALSRSKVKVEANSASVDFDLLTSDELRLAKSAFAVDPIEGSNVRAIALGDPALRDPAKRRAAMRALWRITKRDNVSTIWLAQDYGRLGDLEQTLKFFDASLRTSGRARDFALPPLVAVLAIPESHPMLGKLLAPEPIWESEFWSAFASSPVAIANARAFFADSGVDVGRMPPRARGQLYRNLKGLGRFSDLFEIASRDASFSGEANGKSLDNFSTGSASNPFGWTLYSDGNFTARSIDGGKGLEISAQPETKGLAADRIVRLTENGRISLALARPVPKEGRIALGLRCGSGAGSQLATVTLTPGRKAGEASWASQGCRYAYLQIDFRAGPNSEGAVFAIERYSFQTGGTSARQP